MTSKHLIHQFKLAIHEALSSKPSVRAIMRARSGKQRFPVAQWVEDLETLQSTAIEKHKKYARRGDLFSRTPVFSSHRSSSSQQTSQGTETSSQDDTTHADISRHFGSRKGPGHTRNRFSRGANSQSIAAGAEESSDDENVLSSYGDQQFSPPRRRGPESTTYPNMYDSGEGPDVPPGLLRDGMFIPRPGSPSPYATSGVNTPNPPSSGMTTPTCTNFEDPLLNPPLATRYRDSSNLSLLSVESIVKEKQDYNLQKVNPFFTDSTNEYARNFAKKLANLNGKNSEDSLCIEEYLSKSEKDWFNKYRDVKLGRSPMGSTPASSIFRVKMSRAPSPSRGETPVDEKPSDEFLLPKDYVPPSGLRRLLLYRIGDWPLYSIILAFVSQAGEMKRSSYRLLTFSRAKSLPPIPIKSPC